jgi:hypothetical protein
VAIDKTRATCSRVAWRCSGRKPSTDLVGAGSSGVRCHFSSWRHLPWNFIYTLDGFISLGETPSFGFPCGRWLRQCRFLLGGIILESLHSMAGVCFFSCRHDSGCRGSGSEWRPCESRRRPQRPCWATFFMRRRSCFHGLVAILCC